MKEFAKDYHARRLGNCAQSVAAAWAQTHPEAEGLIPPFAAVGGGRAEDGLCGALYAALQVRPQDKERITEFFKEKSGCLVRCREIRSAKTLSCNDCVGAAAEILDILESRS